MRITVLIENAPAEGLVHEHGLSFYIEYEGRRFLLDAGASGRFAENAAALGLDLSKIEFAVLSHGHYDHGDGLGAFFAANDHAPVYLRPDAMNPQYHETDSGQKFIGVDPGLLERFRPRFTTVEGIFRPAPGVYLVPDRAPHEHSLVFETDRGLVVLNSCCHAGAGHIVAGVLAAFPGQRVCALLGGFHLMGREGTGSLGVAPDTVKSLARQLTDRLGVCQIYTGHCTGRPAMALLTAERPHAIHPLKPGLTVEFETHSPL